MTQLAIHIHPNDSAFEELVRGTWSRTEGPSLQRKKDFKSDLGDDVDQDVLEFIDEDEKKEFDMVKTAAKRRIQLAKQNVNDELVEARAKFAPKKKPKAKPKAKAQNQQGSKRKKSEKKESTTRTNKKRKLTGAEIAKRAKRLAIVDEVPNEPVDAMQIVLLEPEQSNHTAVLPPEQPAQVSQPQGVVPNSNELSSLHRAQCQRRLSRLPPAQLMILCLCTTSFMTLQSVHQVPLRDPLQQSGHQVPVQDPLQSVRQGRLQLREMMNLRRLAKLPS